MNEPTPDPSNLFTICVWIVWAIIGIIVWVPIVCLACREIRFRLALNSRAHPETRSRRKM